MIGGPIRRVLVAGGGIAGWSAAAALKRRCGWLDVAVIALDPPADALADRMPATLPSILGFHDDLGLGDDDAVVRTGASFRLGTRFVEWTEGGDYVHGYGEHGRPFGTASFHQHWVRAAQDGAAAPFDRHAPAAVLARAGRFAPPAANDEAPLSRYEYGLVLDPAAYAAMLRAFARHLGVAEHKGALRGAVLRDDGFVAAVETEAGRLEADLFVDATGPAARLRSALGGMREDWSRWLPCDRLRIAPPRPAAADPAPLDQTVAAANGWRWHVEGLAATFEGQAFASVHGDPGGEGETVALAQGSFAEPWLRNVVAIGDAATVVEQLEWANLHLAHSGIDRLVTMLPGRDCAPVELAEYNRQSAAEAGRVRDFLTLHYITARRPEPFWLQAAAAEPSPALALTLTQFAERGRLPFHEEETFARDSWLAVLLGQGVIPRRADPLIEPVPPADSAAAMARWREAIAAAAAAAPTHAAYLRSLAAQVAR